MRRPYIDGRSHQWNRGSSQSFEKRINCERGASSFDPGMGTDRSNRDLGECAVANEYDQEKNNNFVGGFVHSFGHSLIQGPIDGVREIVNTITSKEVVPKVEIVKSPEKADHGTPAWTGQQLGKTAGIIGMIFVIGRIFRVRI